MSARPMGFFDDETGEVRKLDALRPVPPRRRVPARPSAPAAAAPRPSVRSWPVYDPFSARRRRAPEWLVGYVAVLVALDLVAAGIAVALAFALPLPDAVPPVGVAVVVTAGWSVLQLLVGSYAERRLGTGAGEFRRVTTTGLVALALTGFVYCFVPGLERLVLVGAPVATLLTLLGRFLARVRLHAARRRGRMTKQVILVGREVAVIDLVGRMRRDADAGLKVVGACVPNPLDSSLLVAQGIPVLGGLGDVVRVLDDARADAVLVASASETAGHYLRDLAWRLEGTNIEVLVSPGVIEVVPARLQVRPTTSVPLLQIREPEFRGSRRLVKDTVDRLLAAVLLLLGSPVFLAIAVAIKVTSPGPVLYRHRRIGKRGRQFDLLKFRTMEVGADARMAALMALNEGNAVQFKMRRDPRVTRVGAFLRRFSIDELPQLLNVLGGSMSLVGPRPHVTREVEMYGPDMHRRLLVKPGLTGLWQVSGRSNLTWEQAVELDVRYVENWSIGLDLTILWRTFRAVLSSTGAY